MKASGWIGMIHYTLSQRQLVHMSSYSPFCPKFRSHCNEGQSGNNSIGSIRWPIRENPSIGAKISQISLTQGEL